MKLQKANRIDWKRQIKNNIKLMRTIITGIGKKHRCKACGYSMKHGYGPDGENGTVSIPSEICIECGFSEDTGYSVPHPEWKGQS